MSNRKMDLIISAAEINDHHGVGILLHRFFPDSTRFVTLRSLTLYGGEEKFGTGHHVLRSACVTPEETMQRLRRALASYRIRRILCIPYTREDFIHGLLAQELLQVPLCTYLMDDQNIYTRQVPDHWVQALLKQSKLCLGISPELCAAYQHKFGVEMHLLPPLVEQVGPMVPCYWQADDAGPTKVAMIGNVWTATRFEQLRAVVRTTGIELDWYGNGAQAAWLPGTPEEWEQDGIRCLGHLPEEDLLAALAGYPCVLVPSGTLNPEDDNISFSRLSLPSRLIFLHTGTDTPVLVLGSPRTAAGRFVLHLGTGLCADYDAADLREKLAHLQDPGVHRQMRQAIRRAAPHLVLPNAGQWLWDALDQGSPPSAPFRSAFPLVPSTETWLTEIPAPMSKSKPRFDPRKRSITDEEMPYFAFLRNTHLPFLRHSENDASYIRLGYELSQVTQLMLGFLVRRLLPDGGSILVLGSRIPDWVASLPAEFTVWRARDFPAWQEAGFSNEPGHLVPVAAEGKTVAPAAGFDAVISANSLYQVTAPAQLEQLRSTLDQLTEPGGFNLHMETAVLDPEFFWWPAAFAYLRTHWRLTDWPGLDDILTCKDVFFMSEAAYAKYWEHQTGKTYAEFGKAMAVTLFWRKPVDAGEKA